MSPREVAGFSPSPPSSEREGSRDTEHSLLEADGDNICLQRENSSAQSQPFLSSNGQRTAEPSGAVSGEQVAHMVGRFLSWKLPADFSPDAGISFKAEFNEGTPWPMRHEPSGTNLLNADQAGAMVRHMLKGLPEQFGDLGELEAQEEIPLPSPLGALRFRMEQGGHTQADLAKLIGSRSRASEILAGKRELSKAQMRRLVSEWGIPAASLLAPPPQGVNATGAEAFPDNHLNEGA